VSRQYISTASTTSEQLAARVVMWWFVALGEGGAAKHGPGFMLGARELRVASGHCLAVDSSTGGLRSIQCEARTQKENAALSGPLHSLSTPPRSATSLARAGSRRPPQRHPPCVFRSPALFSACSRLTAHMKPGFCVVCLPYCRRPLELCRTAGGH
jgi:hypothetical protein